MAAEIPKNPQLNPQEEKPKERPVLPTVESDDLPEIKVRTTGETSEEPELVPAWEEGAEPEIQEKAPEEFLDQAREKYLRAKLQIDKRKEGLESTSLTEEEKARHFEIDPKAKQMLADLEAAQKEYFTERQIYLQQRLNAAEKEMDEKGLKDEERKAELEKGGTQFLVSEFTKVYNLKSQFEAEAKTKEVSAGNKFLGFFRKLAEDYKSAPLKTKLVLAGALVGGTVVAAGTGGGVGLALGALITGEYALQKVLASGALSVGLESWLKKSQEKALNVEAIEQYQRAVSESLEKREVKTATDMVNYLKLSDAALESKMAGVMGDLKEWENKMRFRRYLMAGTLGTLVGSGVAMHAVENVMKLFGGSPEGVVVSPEEIAKEKSPIIPEGSSSEEAIKASETLEYLHTIEKGGSVSGAAQALAAEAKMSPEEFRAAWENSTVEVDGVKVPIKDIALVHEGDQVRFIVGEGGGPGHFEVIDVKDKLSIGTNQDLYAMYEQAGKQPPKWLETAVAEDAAEAFRDNQLDANEIRNLRFHFEHGNLGEKEDILKGLFDKMGEVVPEEGGKDFSDLFAEFSNAESYANAVEGYNDYIWRNTRLSLEQYDAVKNMTVKEFMAHRGRSWWGDYFFSKEIPFASPQEARAEEIFRQRKLADLLRPWYSADKANLTIEQFLQRMPTPWY